MSRPLADIYLLGVGYGPLLQATRETIDLIKRCRVVLHLTEHHRALRKLNRNVVDMNPLYWTGEDVEVVYERLYRFIREEIARGPGVASVGDGHPLVFDDCHMRLVDDARRGEFECRVLPAISCLDTLTIDLAIDYAHPGLQVFESTELVVNNLAMNPELHTLLLQAGEFGTNVTPDAVTNRPGRFKVLEKHLRKYFPREHRVVIAFSDIGEGPRAFRTRVDKLDYHWRKIFCGTTLYLPPLSETPKERRPGYWK